MCGGGTNPLDLGSVVSVEVKACLFIPTNTKTQDSLCLRGKLLLFPAELWNKNNIPSEYIALTTI